MKKELLRIANLDDTWSCSLIDKLIEIVVKIFRETELKDEHMEEAPSIKTPVVTKSINIDI